MENQNYNKIIDIYTNSLMKYGNSHKSVLWAKGKQDIRFEALTSHNKRESFSILDYGCGLGHLLPYLKNKFVNFKYVGVDIVPDFIDACKKLYPDNEFRLIKDVNEIEDKFDYVLLSGVFNIIYSDSEKRHQEQVLKIIRRLLSIADISISCDFLSTEVDFKYPDAFHQSKKSLLDFLEHEKIRRFIIDQSYLPYEFSLTIFNNNLIDYNETKYCQ